MATVNPMLIDDAKALFNNLQGDEKMLKGYKDSRTDDSNKWRFLHYS